MNFSKLKKASDIEVNSWLKEKLQLTPYQSDLLVRNELVRFSRFSFYKRRMEKKVSPLWRLTLLIWPIYWLLMVAIVMPLTFFFTGKWGLSTKFIDNFHSVWANKINM